MFEISSFGENSGVPMECEREDKEASCPSEGSLNGRGLGRREARALKSAINAPFAGF